MSIGWPESFGCWIRIWAGRAFASSILYKHYLEDPFHDLVQRHAGLFRGGNIFAIGANIGYTAMVFGRAIDPEYKVHACEPEQFNYDLLVRSTRKRKAQERIVAIRSAVGDCDGTIQLWENEHHRANHRILTDSFARQWLQQRQYQAYTLDKHGHARSGVVDPSQGPRYVDLLFSREKLTA
jgi:FkbM family methyltransferase